MSFPFTTVRRPISCDVDRTQALHSHPVYHPRRAPSSTSGPPAAAVLTIAGLWVYPIPSRPSSPCLRRRPCRTRTAASSSTSHGLKRGSGIVPSVVNDTASCRARAAPWRLTRDVWRERWWASLQTVAAGSWAFAGSVWRAATSTFWGSRNRPICSGSFVVRKVTAAWAAQIRAAPSAHRAGVGGVGSQGIIWRRRRQARAQRRVNGSARWGRLGRRRRATAATSSRGCVLFLPGKHHPYTEYGRWHTSTQINLHLCVPQHEFLLRQL